MCYSKLPDFPATADTAAGSTLAADFLLNLPIVFIVWALQKEISINLRANDNRAHRFLSTQGYDPSKGKQFTYTSYSIPHDTFHHNKDSPLYQQLRINSTQYNETEQNEQWVMLT
jgi:hypothetical protein